MEFHPGKCDAQMKATVAKVCTADITVYAHFSFEQQQLEKAIQGERCNEKTQLKLKALLQEMANLR